ncbi:hypothetical protein CRUP_038164 [Coryphaenoides rupestris]|nr:hypothetical protein CRUP_038164 [Coryphaenoides rupestris]
MNRAPPRRASRGRTAALHSVSAAGDERRGSRTVFLDMGLCKCPKRKVTNLFCFEHRVNVCEHCLCPSCQGPVFPPPNLASPVADMLRDQLSSVNWARAGLGLPLIEEPVLADDSRDVTDYTDWSTFESHEQSEAYPSHSYATAPSQAPLCAAHSEHGEDRGAPHSTTMSSTTPEHAAVNFTTAATCDSVTMHSASSPRKVYDTREGGHSSVTQIDFDDDKYRRRPTLSWFAQILNSLTWRQRVFMFLLVGVLAFLTLIIVMAKLGRASAGSDPNLDPLMNPNIRIGKN